MAKDAKTRAKARAMYEDLGRSSRDIAEVLGLNHQTVLLWSKNGQWVKGINRAKIEQIAHEAKVKEAQRRGLTEAVVTEKIVELMHAQKTVFHQGDAIATVKDHTTQLGATNLGAEVLKMKRDSAQEALTAGIFTFYRDMLAQKRGKR